jgi:hypothetical protein
MDIQRQIEQFEEEIREICDVVHRHGDLLNAIGREPAALQSGDLPERLVGWLERIQTVLAGPDATVEQRVRATVAIHGLARTTTLLPDAPVEEVRETAVEAALAALGPGADDPPVDPGATTHSP